MQHRRMAIDRLPDQQHRGLAQTRLLALLAEVAALGGRLLRCRDPRWLRGLRRHLGVCGGRDILLQHAVSEVSRAIQAAKMPEKEDRIQETHRTRVLYTKTV